MRVPRDKVIRYHDHVNEGYVTEYDNFLGTDRPQLRLILKVGGGASTPDPDNHGDSSSALLVNRGDDSRLSAHFSGDGVEKERHKKNKEKKKKKNKDKDREKKHKHKHHKVSYLTYHSSLKHADN